MGVQLKSLSLCLLLFLTTILLSAQQAPPGTQYEDTVRIQWSKAEWFGKSRFRIPGYGSGKYISGISSSSQTIVVNHREELASRHPFRIEFRDSASAVVKIKGKKYATSGAWVESNSIFFNVVVPNIQEETFMEDEVDMEIISAEIRQSPDGAGVWKLYVKRRQSDGAISDALDAFLKNDKRIIQIRNSGGAGENSTGYEFVEGGKVIAKTTRNGKVVLFPKNSPMGRNSLILAVVTAL